MENENKIYSLTDSEFEDLIKNSINIKEVLFKLGMTANGNSWGYSQVKQRMLSLGLKGYDFKGKGTLKLTIKPVSPDKLLSQNSKHTRAVLRRYIINNRLLEYKCSCCGISSWNGKTLSLELDHINGVNNDNRLENLRFLCPNCHSQTNTYGSRNCQLNESRFDIPEELESKITKLYLEIKNKNKVAKILNIRQKAVDITINKAGLTRSNQRFVIRKDSKGNEIMRFGCINDAARYLIDNGELKTKLTKTARNSFLRNKDKFWLDSYWEILDA